MSSRAQSTLNLERPEAWPRARAPKASEAQVQAAVLKFLQLHPKVAFAHRQNTGAAYMVNLDSNGNVTGKPRFVRFAFKGCADILGMLKDGRWLAIECKSHNGRPTPDQTAFLRTVRDNNGVAGVAWSLDDAVRIINDATNAEPF